MEHNMLSFALSVFTGFFAVMNPIANTPIFVGLTEGLDEASKNKVAKKSTFVAFIITSCFVLSGHLLFQMFGLTIPSFKMTGGILLFYVGFQMLESKKSAMHHSMNDDEISSVAVSPLAIPILAGPGTLVTGINFASEKNVVDLLVVILCFGIMCLLTYWSFKEADRVMKHLGKSFITVLGKIMGLILSVMGMDMLIEGIKLAFLK